MNKRARKNAVRLAKSLLPAEEWSKLEAIKKNLNDAGFGYDIFGYEWESGLLGYLFVRQFYKHYFRAESEGIENVPAEGRAILASNHSGIVPVDGMMILVDCINKLTPARMPRAVVEKMFTMAPFS